MATETTPRRCRSTAPATLAGALIACVGWTAVPVAAQGPVPIGLVVPADEGRAEAMLHGAGAAVDEANARGGFRGRPFELRVVAEDGLWGQGLSRVVGLAFDPGVAGVVGGADGRSGHLIQQVVTKARIPLVVPWASDFTLSRGMIPWSFQTVPDDRQQADAIVGHVVAAGLAGPDAPGPGLLVVGDTSYDSRRFVEALRAAAVAAGVTVRDVDMGDPADPGPGPVVVAGASGPAAAAMDRLGRLPSPPVVYVPLRLAEDGVELAAYPAPVYRPALGGGGLPPARGRHAVGGGPEPSLVEALTRDAVAALIAAVREAGPDPWRVRDALARGSVDGWTGAVAFDERGRRVADLRLVAIERRGK